MKKSSLEDYSWIMRGSQRHKIILSMDTEPQMPTEVKERSGLSLNNVSDVLRALAERKLARCLNPEAKTGRLYILTEKGKTLRDALQKKKENNYSI